MKFIENIKINGEIEVINGLHIGAGKEALEIGGLDNAVIKNPMTNIPYIPGSSLKGKLRFLTEWRTPGAVKNGYPHSCDISECKICKVFGTTVNAKEIRGITRLIVRDANVIGEFSPETMLEIKYSNTINRMTGTSDKGLRTIERVVPGVKFAFELVYRVFDLGDDGNADYENFKIVTDALIHLENDTLGGSGSRGCGQIAFRGITVSGGKAAGNYSKVVELLEKINQG